jgi:hypothetical protein
LGHRTPLAERRTGIRSVTYLRTFRARGQSLPWVSDVNVTLVALGTLRAKDNFFLVVSHDECSHLGQSTIHLRRSEAWLHHVWHPSMLGPVVSEI